MKVGLAQIHIIFENKVQNKLVVEQYIQNAVSHEVDYILFPEMTLTGFTMNVDNMGEKQNESLEWFKQKAKKYNISIGFGYIRKIEDKGENRFVTISKNGAILCEYAKIHPFSFADEDRYYVPGDKVITYKIEDFIASAFICYDLRFPEIFQVASEKAGLITVIANWPKKRKEHWETLIKARAIENQCYICAVNCVGKVNELEYSGNSMVVDPSGNMLATLSGEEGLIICDIHSEEVLRVREAFRVKNDRKKSLYLNLYKGELNE